MNIGEKMNKGKKDKLEKLKQENPDKEICGGCNRIKEDCICGRPTQYDPKYCEEIVNYFETCQAEILVDIKFFNPNKNNPISKILNPLAKEEQEETLNAASVKEIQQKLVMQRFPSLVRYARIIGVNKNTITNWGEQHEEFLSALEECKEIQETILIENGLQGLYNGPFAMFLLKNNHGYIDKTVVDNNIKVTEEEEKEIEELLKQNNKL